MHRTALFSARASPLTDLVHWLLDTFILARENQVSLHHRRVDFWWTLRSLALRVCLYPDREGLFLTTSLAKLARREVLLS